MSMKDKYRVIVNGKEIRLDDPVPDGRQILALADLDPADEHVLIELRHHETRSIGNDEPVELQEDGTKSFKAFRNDRTYRFTIDGRSYEWGASRIDEPTLREIAEIKGDQILVLEREDEEDQELGPDDFLDLDEPGTEHIHTKSRLVTVYLDSEPRQVPCGTYTADELVGLLGAEPGYRLNLLKKGKLVLLEPDEKVKLKDEMQFISQLPAGGAS